MINKKIKLIKKEIIIEKKARIKEIKQELSNSDHGDNVEDKEVLDTLGNEKTTLEKQLSDNKQLEQEAKSEAEAKPTTDTVSGTHGELDEDFYNLFNNKAIVKANISNYIKYIAYTVMILSLTDLYDNPLLNITTSICIQTLIGNGMCTIMIPGFDPCNKKHRSQANKKIRIFKDKVENIVSIQGGDGILLIWSLISKLLKVMHLPGITNFINFINKSIKSIVSFKQQLVKYTIEYLQSIGLSGQTLYNINSKNMQDLIKNSDKINIDTDEKTSEDIDELFKYNYDQEYDIIFTSCTDDRHTKIPNIICTNSCDVCDEAYKCKPDSCKKGFNYNENTGKCDKNQ